MRSSSEKTIKKDNDDLLKTIGIENAKATIFLTDLTSLTPTDQLSIKFMISL